VKTRLHFSFALSPLSELQGWESSQSHTKSLDWFGLTYGHYWIEVGETTLFEYTPEILEYWRQKGQKDMETTLPYARYVEYQVARLWEDLLTLYRAVLEPVPADISIDLYDLRNLQAVENWERLCMQVQSDEAQWGKYLLGFWWWCNHRTLISSHFVSSPTIHAWRIQETIYFYVQNNSDDNTIEGIPIFHSDKKLWTFSVIEFIEAMEDFNKRLMDAMEERIEQVIAGGLQGGITCDIPALKHVHEDRKTWWANCLEHPYTTDWGEVRNTLHALRQDIAGTNG
jgi:hypothetical protein